MCSMVLLDCGIESRLSRNVIVLVNVRALEISVDRVSMTNATFTLPLCGSSGRRIADEASEARESAVRSQSQSLGNLFRAAPTVMLLRDNFLFYRGSSSYTVKQTHSLLYATVSRRS